MGLSTFSLQASRVNKLFPTQCAWANVSKRWAIIPNSWRRILPRSEEKASEWSPDGTRFLNRVITPSYRSTWTAATWSMGRSTTSDCTSMSRCDDFLNQMGRYEWRTYFPNLPRFQIRVQPVSIKTERPVYFHVAPRLSLQFTPHFVILLNFTLETVSLTMSISVYCRASTHCERSCIDADSWGLPLPSTATRKRTSGRRTFISAIQPFRGSMRILIQGWVNCNSWCELQNQTLNVGPVKCIQRDLGQKWKTFGYHKQKFGTTVHVSLRSFLIAQEQAYVHTETM